MSLRAARALALLSCTTLAACGVGSGILGVAGTEDAVTVQFVNATDSPLDLAVNGTVPGPNGNIVSGASVGCFSVPDPAQSGLTVRRTGTTADLSGFTPFFSSGGRYTVVAFSGASGLIQFINVPNAFVPVAGRSALRVFHGSSGLGVVDVHVTAPGATLGTPSFPGLGFGTATGSFDVSAGTVQVRLTSANTTTVVLDAGSRVLQAGRSYTLVVSNVTAAAILVPDC